MKLTKIGPDQFEIVQPTCIMDQVSVSPVSVGSDLHLPKFWPTLKAESATLQAAENFRAKTVRSTSFDDFCYILISLFSVIIEGREVKNLVIRKLFFIDILHYRKEQESTLVRKNIISMVKCEFGGQNQFLE